MAQFNVANIENFLAVVRKYMQLRGSLSQKDLAEMTETGVSTMSRFLNRKTNDLNPQLIAKIVAKLNIPLHEMIDFVEEDYADHFIRLVKFYKEGDVVAAEALAEEDPTIDEEFEDGFTQTLSSGTAKQSATAKVKVGGKSRNIHYTADEEGSNSETSIRKKLESLSPRQKAYMSDFLNLDMEGRDLIVDIGNDLLRFFRQKGFDF